MKTDREPHEADNDELRGKRARRLQDCLRNALDHPDPLQALLRASSGDLAETAGQLKEAIDQVFQEEPDLRSVFAEVLPLLEMYLKYQRQFDRFVQLDHRLNTPSSSPAAPTSSSAPSPPSATASPPSSSTALLLAGKVDEASEESQI